MIEKNQQGHYSNAEFMSDIWSFVRPYKTKFILGTFIRATSDVVWLFPVWALSEIITFASNYKSGDSTLYAWQLLLGILIAGIYYFIAHDLCKYYIYQVAENANIDAQKNTTKYLYSLDMDWHEKENTGNKMQKIVKGGGSLDRIIRMYVDLVIESSVNLIAILVILTFLNIYFTVILIFFFVSYYLLSSYLTKKAVYQSHVCNLEWENFNGASFESVNNISLIQSLRIGDKIFPFLKKIGS